MNLKIVVSACIAVEIFVLVCRLYEIVVLVCGLLEVIVVSICAMRKIAAVLLCAAGNVVTVDANIAVANVVRANCAGVGFVVTAACTVLVICRPVCLQTAWFGLDRY